MFLRLEKLVLGVALPVLALLVSAAHLAAQGNYVIGSGDVLQIEVLEDPSLNRSVLVLPDGTISFPMAGTLRAGGRSVDQVRGTLSAALAPNFAATPNVYVSVASLAEGTGATGPDGDLMDVYALGEFTVPGRKEIKHGTTILQFLAEAGGLSRFAAEKRIELHRTDSRTGKVTTYLFNYRTPGGSETGINGGTKLTPGDVVKVPQRRLFE